MADLPFDRRTPYVETFDDGPGGWFAWRPGTRMPSPLEECAILPEIMTGQPFHVSPEWTEQTVTLSTNPTEWTCLGARHDLLDYYGCGDIVDVLSDVNVDLILVLFPLDIVAASPDTDVHRIRPHLDYDINWDVLASGRIAFDTIRIEYPLAEPA